MNSKVTITFAGHEQANAFFIWLTEDNALETFEASKWAKIANMFNLEIEELDEDARKVTIK